MRLEGRTALITGGTTGIGLATALLFQREGARVAITGQNEATLAEARAVLGPDALVVRSDAASLAALDALVAEVGAAFGRLDVLFVNAGIAWFAPLEAVTEEHFDRQFAVNVKGPFFPLQKAAPLLREGGSVILNASIVAEKGIAASAVYAATKAALRSFGRTVAVEFAGRGVRVNTISPGPIETPLYGKLGFPDDALGAFKGSMTARSPFGRFGTADEVARVALFYASDDAAYATGTDLLVDGGLAQI